MKKRISLIAEVIQIGLFIVAGHRLGIASWNLGALQPTKNVYVSIRGDDKPGSGSKLDPYDGSTKAKFDAAMSAIPTATHIHLGPGTFITNSITLKEGWWLDGSGKDRTMVKLANDRLITNGAYQYLSVIEHYDWRGFLTYARVSNMAVDCNRDNQPTYTHRWSGYLNGISISTRVGRIENVRVFGVYAKPNEGFPVTLNSGPHATARTSRLEIENCEVLSPRTGGIGKGEGGMTVISFWNQYGGTASGIIKGCRVTDGTFATAAYGGRQWENVEVTNNLSEHCAAGMVLDTENFKNVKISRNKFLRGCNWGLVFNGTGIYSNIEVSDNIIEVVSGDGTCLQPSSGSYRIKSNTFIQKNPGKTAFISAAFSSVIGEMSKNTIIEPLASRIIGAARLNVHDNYDDNGAYKALTRP